MISANQSSSTIALLKDAGLFFALFCVCYAYQFLGLGLDLDEVMDFYGASLDTYTAQDRWGHAAYRLLLGEGTAIWAAGIATAVYLAVAYALQLRLLQVEARVEKLIYLGFYLACPQFASMLGFLQHVDAIALSLLLSTTAIYLFYQQGRKLWLRALLGVLMLSIAAGCYQTSLFYALVLVFACELKTFYQQQQQARFPWARLSKLALIFCAAVALWYALRMITYPLASEQAREYAANYHSSRSQLGIFPSLSLQAKCLYLAHYAKLTVIEALGSLSPTRWLYMTSILPLGYLLFSSLCKLRGMARLGAPLMLALIWVLPFMLIFVLGTEQPERTFLAEPLSLSVLWILAWRQAPQLKMRPLVQRAMLLFLAFALIKTLYHAAAQERKRNHNYSLLVQDFQQMERLRVASSFAEEKNLHVMLLPIYEEEFDSLILMPPYMHLQRLDYFSTPSDLTVRKSYVDKLKGRPYWPDIKSVIRESDTLIIKYQAPWRRKESNKLAL